MASSQSGSGWLCPACRSMMYPAYLLKGYPRTGPESERMTCALHGPRGQFRHLATDRKTLRPGSRDD